MKVHDIYVHITSENPEAVFAFYRDVVGLARDLRRIDRPVKLYVGPTLRRDEPSESERSATGPSRWMLDLFVDDVKAERERMEAAGVTFVRKEERQDWGGIISTFVGPDGNYGQLIWADDQPSEELPE